MTADTLDRSVPTAGKVGVGAGLLTAVMVVWERVAGFELGDPGVAVAVQQTGIVLGMLGFVVLAVGLYRARVGGDGRVARSWPLVLAAGWLVLAVAIPVEAASSLTVDDDPLNPIGGLAQVIGLLGLGITVAAAGRWTGWLRWFPLAFAVYSAALVAFAVATGDWPPAVLEVAAALGYGVLGAALLLDERTPIPAG